MAGWALSRRNWFEVFLESKPETRESGRDVNCFSADQLLIKCNAAEPQLDGACRAGACPGIGRPKWWPYTRRKMFVKKTRNYPLAMQ